MGRFIIHGTIAEEPAIIPFGADKQAKKVVVEERFEFGEKSFTRKCCVLFIAKGMDCVPTNITLVGAPVVIFGTISSREYQGKYYNDLYGDQFSVLTTKSFTKHPEPTQESVDDVREQPSTDLASDDLPF